MTSAIAVVTIQVTSHIRRQPNIQTKSNAMFWETLVNGSTRWPDLQALPASPVCMWKAPCNSSAV